MRVASWKQVAYPGSLGSGGSKSLSSFLSYSAIILRVTATTWFYVTAYLPTNKAPWGGFWAAEVGQKPWPTCNNDRGWRTEGSHVVLWKDVMRDHTRMDIDCSSRKKIKTFCFKVFTEIRWLGNHKAKAERRWSRACGTFSKLVNMCITCYATFSTAACFKFSSE